MDRRGFTLIELLIVVAIIGILAAIAVPNFLNARTKAMVARVKADFKAVGMALESYFLDLHAYPADEILTPQFHKYQINPCGKPLTSPVAYISNIDLQDPFVNEVARLQLEPGFEGNYTGSYTYYNYSHRFGTLHLTKCALREKNAFSLMTYGPNLESEGLFALPGIIACPDAPIANQWPAIAYAPSNGLRSAGDIVYFGGDLPVGGLMGG